MKKIICLIICAATLGILFGCSSQTEESGAPQTAESAVSQTSESATPRKVENATPQTAESAASNDKEIVNLDLTLLSGTMVYAEVYDMMYHPENYIGKKIRMNGTYTLFHDDNTGKDYHGCIVKDATACCAQGIEFELTNDYVYPDDYPAEGGQICIVGVFDTYNEGANTYCILKGAKIERL